ncbi:hypothetical protein [Deinococcus sp. S9]|uniref:hypothetical protein n=1 Tax=Deinococcus sp. S9 TaxID=2545754 RepID=UPI0010541E62|nr:hypothetical protein [Deinococcus sp. S9]TDE87404.1 hypothetical protein E0686_02615 [Deinococcus sp. S9]
MNELTEMTRAIRLAYGPEAARATLTVARSDDLPTVVVQLAERPVPAHLQGEVAVVSTPSPLGFAGLTEICVPRSGELYVVENSALRPVGGRSAR